MERATTSELLKTIESQKEQLKRYESRLRDVVRAYKGLVTEKEALEASLKVLSSVRHDTASTSIPESSSPDAGDDIGDNPQRMKEQIQTLSSSLATLTQEKSRLESSLVADKKKLMVENDDLQKALEHEKKQRHKETADLQSQLVEFKGFLRSHQLERETEQTNHGIMIKELQLLLAEERATKELMETQLEHLQLTLKENNTRKKGDECEKRIADLTQEVETLRQQLKNADVKTDMSPGLLSELQREMEKMKKNYQVQVAEEVQRANDAELRLNISAKQAEERICGLESKLSEISTIMGNYDKLRMKDQDVITHLKERVSQLDNENASLTRAVSSPTNTSADNSLDSKSIAEKLLYFRDLLHAANEKTDFPIDIPSLLSEGEKTDIHHPHCSQYKEELERLKEEFERYKLRAQSVLKNKNKDSSNKEMEILKDQVGQMKDKIRHLHQEHLENSESLQMKIDHLTRSLQTEEEKHKESIANLHSKHAKEIREMEQELRKQRERTITMLSEKENEISLLKNTTGHSLELEYLREMRETQTITGDITELGDEDAVGKLFVHSQANQETLLLHFAQEQARRDVEIASLRKQKRQMEGTLRDVQHSSTLKQQQLLEENEKLKEDIWKQQRNFRRENANLEYLKNVIFNFLTSSDRQGKKQMLKAIMTILQFSPKEVDKVKTQGNI